MFCPDCGKEIPAGTNECPNCHRYILGNTGTVNVERKEPVAENTGNSGKSYIHYSMLDFGLVAFQNLFNGTVKKNIQEGRVNWIAAIASVLAIISAWLPVVEFKFDKYSAFAISTSETWMMIILAVFILVFVLSGEKTITVIAGGIYVLLALALFLWPAHDAMKAVYGMGKYGIGLYLMIISGVVIVGTQFMKKK